MPKQFWDTPLQKKKAFNYAKRWNLPYNDPVCKEELREKYRKKEREKAEKEKREAEEEKGGKLDGIKRPIYPNTGVKKHLDKLAVGTKSEPVSRPAPTGATWDGDYFDWYEYFIQPFFPNPKPMGVIHQVWAEEIESDDLLLMLKPRDHYKTTFISIGYTLYSICERIYYPVLIVSLSKKNTRDVYGSIKQHLETNQRLLDFYGYLINDNRPKTQEGFFLIYQEASVKDPGVFCATFLSKTVMGTHPKLAILDDIQERPLSPNPMDLACHLIDASLLPAIGVDGKLIIVGTIKGGGPDDDIYLYCDAKDVFSIYEDPAVYLVDKDGKELKDKEGKRVHDMPDMNDVEWHRGRVPKMDPRTGKPMIRKSNGEVRTKIDVIVDSIKDEWKYRTIYPEVYPIAEIVKKRIIIRDKRRTGGGDAKFWSEYFLRPFNPRGVYFQKDRIGGFGEQGCPFLSVKEFIETLRTEGIGTYLCLDPGGKGKHGMAISVTTPYRGDHYLVDCAVIREGVPATAKMIAKLIIQYHVIGWGIEGNFMQAEMGELIGEKVYKILKKSGHGTLYTNPKIFQVTKDKELRINTNLTIIIEEDGPIQFFVNRKARSYDQLQNEILTFPFVKGNINHEFDILDTIASAKAFLYGSDAFLFWGGGSRHNPLRPPPSHERYF